MKTNFCCASCGKSLEVVYWSQQKPWCSIHCLLNWQVREDLRRLKQTCSQLDLRFTDDSPATVE